MNLDQEMLRGDRGIKRLGEILSEKGDKRVLIFHGIESWKNPVFQRLTAILQSHDAKILEFSDIPNNPDFESIEKARVVFIDFNPTIVIACGGGSVIDITKGVLATGSLGNAEKLLEGKPLFKDRPFFVVIPTTAGSGSEATSFAVIYKDKRKHSIEDKALKPDVVLHHPLLTSSCPLSVTLASGADAICHALESIWARTGTIRSRKLASEALELLYPNLLRIADNPQNTSIWADMQKGAWLAGSAINISKTTAGHAMSYSLTMELGIPHGFAVLMAMQFLVPYMESRYFYFSRVNRKLNAILFHGSNGKSLPFQAFVQEVTREIWARMIIRMPANDIFKGKNALTRDLSRESLIRLLLDKVNIQRLENHPVALSQDDLLIVYGQVLDHLGYSR